MRLTRKADFAHVMDEGRSRSGPLLVIRFLRNDLGHPRVGFTASRAIGSAVRRNRAKRLLREAVRRAPVGGGWDMVFIARASIGNATLQEVRAATEETVKRTPAWAGEAAPQQNKD